MHGLSWGFVVILLLASCMPAAQMPVVETPIIFTHEAFDPGETENPRWHAQTTLELIPRDDYGELYPYPGGMRSDEWAWVGFGELAFSSYGFCTADGTIVCDPAFAALNRFAYGDKACYTFLDQRQGDAVCLAASDGRFVQVYDEVLDAHEGTLAVREGDKWGAVDFDGNTLLPCVYEFPMYFGEGLAAVTRDFDTGYEYVDRQGNIVFSMPPTVPRARIESRADSNLYIAHAYRSFFNEVTFQDERAAFWTADERIGYIDKQGRVAIEAQFDAWAGVGKFYLGMAVVTQGNRMIVIDRDGTELNISREMVPSSYVPGPQRFEENGKYGYMDADGNVCLPPDYDNVTQMGEYYMVLQGMHGGLIDGDGKWVIKRFMVAGENGN